jgi:hypothetical protein
MCGQLEVGFHLGVMLADVVWRLILRREKPKCWLKSLVWPETHFLALEKTFFYLLLNLLFWIRGMFGMFGWMGLKFEFEILKLWQIFIIWI